MKKTWGSDRWLEPYNRKKKGHGVELREVEDKAGMEEERRRGIGETKEERCERERESVGIRM